MTPRILEGKSGVAVIDAVGVATVDEIRAVVKQLVERAAGAPSTAVIGGLSALSLDAAGRAALDALGRWVVRVDVDSLVVIGERLRALHLGAVLEGSWSEESVLVPDVATAIEVVIASLAADERRHGGVLAVAGDAPGLAGVVDALVGR